MIKFNLFFKVVILANLIVISLNSHAKVELREIKDLGIQKKITPNKTPQKKNTLGSQSLKLKTSSLTVKTSVQKNTLDQLPELITSLINNWNPKFIINKTKDYSQDVQSLFIENNIKNVPYGFINDLDNNSEDDFVLIGHDQKLNYIIVVFQIDGDYNLRIIDEWPRDLSQKNEEFYIIPAESEFLKQKSLRGIQKEKYLAPPSVFFFEDGDLDQVYWF